MRAINGGFLSVKGISSGVGASAMESRIVGGSVADQTTRTLRVITGGQEVPEPEDIVNNWNGWNTVKRIVVHQGWDKVTKHNDIALVQLKRPANTGKTSIIESSFLKVLRACLEFAPIGTVVSSEVIKCG